MSEKICKVYQFKITLNVQPKVWRRIQILEKSTFKDLHFAIKKSMGWNLARIYYHLHNFSMDHPGNNKNYSSNEDYQGPQEKSKIADYFIPPNVTAKYLYDFGRGWNHTIKLEKILPAVSGTAYPKCIAGKWACPPEDGVYDEDEDPSEYESKYFDPKSVKFYGDD